MLIGRPRLLIIAYFLQPLLRILDAHELPSTALRFSPGKGDLLVSASADNSVRVIVIPDSFASSWCPFLPSCSSFAILTPDVFSHSLYDARRASFPRPLPRLPRCAMAGAPPGRPLLSKSRFSFISLYFFTLLSSLSFTHSIFSHIHDCVGCLEFIGRVLLRERDYACC